MPLGARGSSSFRASWPDTTGAVNQPVCPVVVVGEDGDDPFWTFWVDIVDTGREGDIGREKFTEDR